ncbi:ABC transporter ATP-binding protein [Dethiosulfovibrio salsuginis]|uniref:Simple sugar transport system ATP-binding protein n=1 Tax=Dethiosulfovibrio salsuginis TaxID=561720 RepID=A0A1X7KKS8_9BACT|nr:simple sugar transport system ATP-binding protein [Dethiosulfovibrio salsuginis]
MVEPNALLVEMKGITKSFQGIKANDQIDLTLKKGEVLALLGENGAGKSTLMNVLSGIYLPDGGTIDIGGTRLSFRSPNDAISAGIGMVHQHFMLVPSQTVWENMVLGLPDLPQILPKGKIISEITAISKQYGLEVDPEAIIWQLSIGEQQRVEILKTLYRNAQVLILDEPTAVLTPQEARSLFNTIKRMTEEGRGIIFISHKLDEVMEISDRVTVLRKGKLIGTVDRENASKEKIAEMMVGKRINLDLDKKDITPGEVVYSLSQANAISDRGLKALDQVSLELREGQILGLAGVAGNGQTELCQVMAGLRKMTSGKLILKGKEVTDSSPRELIDGGIRYIPADRKGTGMVSNMDVRENSTLKRYWRRPVARGVLIDWKAVLKHALGIVKNFNVDTPSVETPVRNLSGGNIQKLMLGRELSDIPKVLIAMNPTWGLDVAATRFVREQLLEEREKGAAIFLISEDLDELMSLSDRIAVMYRGKIMGLVEDPNTFGIERIGMMMAGTRIEQVGGGL